MTRKEIMQNCPEEFEDDLKEFIDEIEGELNSIKDHMDIRSLTDLERIDEAHDMIIKLAEDLY
jgi:hypothetical protein